MLKGADVIPMPSASVTTTSVVRPGVRRRLRMAYVVSSRKSVSQWMRRMSRISSLCCSSPPIARSAA